MNETEAIQLLRRTLKEGQLQDTARMTRLLPLTA